jgi:hypothetical protein
MTPRRLRYLLAVSLAFLAGAAAAFWGVGKTIDRALNGIFGG